MTLLLACFFETWKNAINDGDLELKNSTWFLLFIEDTEQ